MKRKIRRKLSFGDVVDTKVPIHTGDGIEIMTVTDVLDSGRGSQLVSLLLKSLSGLTEGDLIEVKHIKKLMSLLPKSVMRQGKSGYRYFLE